MYNNMIKTQQQQIADEILEDLADQLLTTMIKDRSRLTQHGMEVFIQRLRLANELMTESD